MTSVSHGVKSAMSWQGTLNSLAFLVCMSITTACSTSSVVLPSSCPAHDAKCQRNLDAQTLTYIGQKDAALQLMCSDPDLRDVIGDDCTGR